MPHDKHPCASLPTSQWSMTVWYCHHHQAFFASQVCYTWASETTYRQSSSLWIEFGPFDTAADVLDWIGSHLDGVPLLPSALDGDDPWEDYPFPGEPTETALT